MLLDAMTRLELLQAAEDVCKQRGRCEHDRALRGRLAVGVFKEIQRRLAVKFDDELFEAKIEIGEDVFHIGVQAITDNPRHADNKHLTRLDNA